jgi:predicted metal-binding membrane protein
MLAAVTAPPRRLHLAGLRHRQVLPLVLGTAVSVLVAVGHHMPGAQPPGPSMPAGHLGAAMGPMDSMGPMAAGLAPAAPSLVAVVAATALMVIPMMSFGLGPMARFVRTRTLQRRWWAAPTVLVTYLLVWLVLGVGVARVSAGVRWPPATVAVILVAAAAWELTPVKRWAVDACQKTVPLRLRGAPATGSEIWFGVHQGAICVVSCWLIMLPMILGAGPALLLMPTGTAVVTAQRLSTRPTRTRRLTAALLVAVAAVVAVISAVDG